jgi:hypothetical protein
MWSVTLLLQRSDYECVKYLIRAATLKESQIQSISAIFGEC